MTVDNTADADHRALININQVAYNTTYAVDFLRDGEVLSETKVYRASRLSVSPASFEVDDDGVCTLASVQNYTENGTTGQGLGFKLDVRCTPTLVTGETPGTFFPTRAERTKGRAPGYEDQYGQQVWCEGIFGDTNNYAVGSYLYTDLIIHLMQVI